MTRALPFTQPAVQRAIKAARKMGLRVTGVTVRVDGFTVNTVEERGIIDITPVQGSARALPSTLTAVPVLRDAREKFRDG